eukprot:gnl/MRDRNA2_/MRDRNA2_160974_c0_seq1.p1 gnl/MRDRNA2_/MRDRNA2_160974_c0~~gnl/MRDRNA2_/MRDRNA2_160974_c0_seq1.p1  ORF type:complete len:611 (+),score=71.35 gnl/MRDRNA2_/MRDRNA2_160974_c0_seq1:171-2003(+)
MLQQLLALVVFNVVQTILYLRMWNFKSLPATPLADCRLPDAVKQNVSKYLPWHQRLLGAIVNVQSHRARLHRWQSANKAHRCLPSTPLHATNKRSRLSGWLHKRSGWRWVLRWVEIVWEDGVPVMEFFQPIPTIRTPDVCLDIREMICVDDGRARRHHVISIATAQSKHVLRAQSAMEAYSWAQAIRSIVNLTQSGLVRNGRCLSNRDIGLADSTLNGSSCRTFAWARINGSDQPCDVSWSVDLGCLMPEEIHLNLGICNELPCVVYSHELADGHHHVVATEGNSSLVAQLLCCDAQALSWPLCLSGSPWLLCCGILVALLTIYLHSTAISFLSRIVLLVPLLQYGLGNGFQWLWPDDRIQHRYFLKLKWDRAAPVEVQATSGNTIQITKLRTPFADMETGKRHASFTGSWTLDTSKSDDPEEYLKTVGASWLQRQGARRLVRSISITHVGIDWTETVWTPLGCKTWNICLDGNEHEDINLLDQSLVISKSFIEHDSNSVITLLQYNKTGHTQRTERQLIDGGETYHIRHILTMDTGDSLEVNAYYNRVHDTLSKSNFHELDSHGDTQSKATFREYDGVIDSHDNYSSTSYDNCSGNAGRNGLQAPEDKI